MKPHPILYPFSLLFGFAVWVRNLLFDIGILRSVDVGVPVISIGNITAGGSGKTPMTIEVAKFFLQRGKKVAVVSRGYDRKSRGTVVVSDGIKISAGVSSGGDETLLIAQQLPNAIVIADERRVRGAKEAIEKFHADVIVLDDGFQHRYLKRVTDIVLFDNVHSPMETMLLPAGYRREPLRSLKRAHAVVVTKVNDAQQAARMLDDARVSYVPKKFSSSYAPVAVKSIFENVSYSINKVQGQSVVVVSGIAHPESFEAEIGSLGGRISLKFTFRDHHIYTREDALRILDAFRKNNADCILTTEKDAVKISQFNRELAGIPVFALVMESRVHQQEEWKKFLSNVA